MIRPRALAIALVAMAVLAAGCGHKGNKVSSSKRSTTSSSGSSSSSSSSTGSSSSSSSSASTGATAGRPAGTAATTAAPRATTPTSPPSGGGASNGRFTKLITLDQPVAAVPVGSALYVAQKTGKVVVLRNGQVSGTVLDLSGQVSTGSEQGLLGVAVAANHLYVDYTNTTGDTRVVEYTLSGDQASAPRQLLAQDQPFANHNGGQVIFGPDGKLYIGLGDGGSADDPNGNGQNLGTWLGKILRIDPTPSGGQPYTVPGDNPFVGRSGAKPEIWAYGLRNPWRFTFDRANGDLWIGDVGQDAWEEVDHVAAGRAGVNYEWDLQEGSHSHQGGSKPAGGVGPVYEYGHSGGNCSITGGYVYRGSRIPGLVGSYVFADFCVGKVFALSGSGVRDLGPVVANLSSFAEDAAGELYALSLSGGVYRIDPA